MEIDRRTDETAMLQLSESAGTAVDASKCIEPASKIAARTSHLKYLGRKLVECIELMKKRAAEVGLFLSGNVAPHAKHCRLDILTVVGMCVMARQFLYIYGATGEAKTVVATLIAKCLADWFLVSCVGDLNDSIFQRISLDKKGRFTCLPSEVVTSLVLVLDELSRVLRPCVPTLKKIISMPEGVNTKWIVATGNPILSTYATQTVDRAIASSMLHVDSSTMMEERDHIDLFSAGRALVARDLPASPIGIELGGTELTLLDALREIGDRSLMNVPVDDEGRMLLTVLSMNRCVKTAYGRKPEILDARCSDCSAATASLCDRIGHIAPKQIMSITSLSRAHALHEYALGRRTEPRATTDDIRIFLPLILVDSSVFLRSQGGNHVETVMSAASAIEQSIRKFVLGFNDVLAALEDDPEGFEVSAPLKTTLDVFSRTENPSVASGLMALARHEGMKKLKGDGNGQAVPLIPGETAGA